MSDRDAIVERRDETMQAPLRVLFVSRWLVDQGGGGVQTYMANAARALAVNSIDVGFAALMPGSIPAFAGAEFHLGEHGVPKWRNAWRLRRWLRRNLPRFDLVVFHGVMDWHFVVGAVECRLRGVPYVARTAGGLLRVPFERAKIRRFRSRLFLRFVVARLLRAAGSVVASTEPERDSILAIDRRIRVRVLPGGTEVPEDPQGAALREQGGAPLRIVFLGRVEPIKNISVLLRAVQILDRRGVAVTLEIIGRGEPVYERKLGAELEELGIGNHVRFCGDLRGEAKRARLASNHVLVLPSDSENFGFVVIEAMAQGVPVVVSDGVGLADIVRRCAAGRVFPRGSSEALASALADYRDPSLLRADARRAHDCARAQFSIEAMGAGLSQFFRDVARAGRA